MTKEEVKNIVDKFARQLALSGTSLELIDFDGANLKLKLNCSNKDVFKVKGVTVTFEDETKKSVEKHLKASIQNTNIIFI
ncbi:MAG: hypothetical protein V1871_03390 [Planctomycetota bacterium]